jgi:hypothetical protein
MFFSKARRNNPSAEKFPRRRKPFVLSSTLRAKPEPKAMLDTKIAEVTPPARIFSISFAPLARLQGSFRSLLRRWHDYRTISEPIEPIAKKGGNPGNLRRSRLGTRITQRRVGVDAVLREPVYARFPCSTGK